jgi:UDP-sugar pyrophosphorylase
MGHTSSHSAQSRFEGEWEALSIEIPRESLALVKEGQTDNWPAALKANRDILSEQETLAASLLIGIDQQHLFENWDLPGINDDKKHALFHQITTLSANYLPEEGGLIAYINNARTLLNNSRNDVNPLDGWVPEVPLGTFLDPFTPEYDRFEQLGLKEVGSCGFVLVAGGLGERLGYKGIKISLPTETLTNTSYIELYCQQILAIQQRYGRPLSEPEGGWPQTETGTREEGRRVTIPLAIMVSDDTEAMTKDLLYRNSYFGLEVGWVMLLSCMHAWVKTSVLFSAFCLNN